MRFLVLLALAYLLYRVLRRFFRSAEKIRKRQNGGFVDDMVQDPYCKAYFPLRDSEKRMINGTECFFCSKECADKYERQMKR